MERILIVDDDPSVTRLLATLLTDEGYDAVPTTSGQRALEIVRENPPRVILLDLMMPVVSGSMICQRLKSDEATRHIPIVVISGDGRAPDKVREIGADDFLLKPFDLDDVIGRVRMWCDERTPAPAQASQGDGIVGKV